MVHLRNSGMVHAYAGVSTDGQTRDAQPTALKRAKAVKIFAETKCGAKRDQPQFNGVLKQLHRADILIVSRRDPLAQSTPDLLT